MTRKTMNCDCCGEIGKMHYSRLTNFYWCHNCNTRSEMKRKFNEDIEEKIGKLKKLKNLNNEEYHFLFEKMQNETNQKTNH